MKAGSMTNVLKIRLPKALVIISQEIVSIENGTAEKCHTIFKKWDFNVIQ